VVSTTRGEETSEDGIDEITIRRLSPYTHNDRHHVDHTHDSMEPLENVDTTIDRSTGIMSRTPFVGLRVNGMDMIEHSVCAVCERKTIRCVKAPRSTVFDGWGGGVVGWWGGQGTTRFEAIFRRWRWMTTNMPAGLMWDKRHPTGTKELMWGRGRV
jgi:hypothetical protein